MYGNCDVCGERFGFGYTSCEHIKQEELEMSKKISVGQCMAEILCAGSIPTSQEDEALYERFGEIWNALSFGFRGELLDGLKAYLIEQLGENRVED